MAISRLLEQKMFSWQSSIAESHRHSWVLFHMNKPTGVCKPSKPFALLLSSSSLSGITMPRLNVSHDLLVKACGRPCTHGHSYRSSQLCRVIACKKRCTSLPMLSMRAWHWSCASCSPMYCALLADWFPMLPEAPYSPCLKAHKVCCTERCSIGKLLHNRRYAVQRELRAFSSLCIGGQMCRYGILALCASAGGSQEGLASLRFLMGFC